MTEAVEQEPRTKLASQYISDVGVLGVLRAITRLRGLILLPIIARGLGPAYYGVWTQSLVLVSIGIHLIDLQLPAALVRFLAGLEDRKERGAIFSSSLLAIIILGSLLAILARLMAAPIAEHLLGDLQFMGIGRWLGLWTMLTAISMLSMDLFRSLLKVKFYGILRASHVLLQLVVVAFAILRTRNLLAAVLAAVGFEFLFALGVLLAAFKQVGVHRPRWSILRQSLKFSLPLIPNKYGAILLVSADRIAIAASLGAEAVGIYAAAFSLAQIVREIFSPISMALFPAASRRWDAGDSEGARWLLSNSMRFYLILGIPALAGVVILGPEVLRILSTEEIAKGVTALIPFLGLAMLSSGTQSIYAILLQLVEDTKALALVRAISALIYSVLILLIVPAFGLVGAAVVTAIGFLVDLGLTMFMAWGHQTLSVPVSSSLKAFGAALVMSLVLVPFNLTNVAELVFGVILGVSVYAAGIWLLKGISQKEIRFLSRLFSRARF